MHNKQLLKEILAEKDPETLMRKVCSLSVRKVSVLSYSDEFLVHVSRITRNNPEIREKLRKEYDRPEYHIDRKD